jgi:transcriptional regulator with XRE-family HTH domain
MDQTRRHTLPLDLGAELRAYRQSQGSTLAQVGERAGVDPSHLGHMEHGRRAPSKSIAERLIEVLGLPSDLAERLRSAAIPNAGRDWPGRQVG